MCQNTGESSDHLVVLSLKISNLSFLLNFWVEKHKKKFESLFILKDLEWNLVLFRKFLTSKNELSLTINLESSSPVSISNVRFNLDDYVHLFSIAFWFWMTNEGQILSSTKIYNQNSYPQDLSDRFTTN